MKIRKIILSTVVPLSIAPTTLVALSAEPGETPKPETNDPDFASFASKQDSLIKESIKEYVQKVINDLFEQAQNLIKDEDTSTIKENYAKALYYQQVAWYLKDNQEKIVQNPYSYGFEIVFPKILGTQKTYKLGEVKVGDRVFSGVSIGTSKPYDYSNLLKKDNIKLEKDNKVNSINFENLEKTTKEYFDGLNSAIEDIFVNNDDLPKFIEDSLELDNEHPSFKLKLPENYNNWKDYIKDKIGQRILKYDLEQNETFNKPEEEIVPPSVEPILPNEEPIQIELNPQSIKRLSPYVQYNFYKTNLENSSENANDLFWFRNPIYTRINYNVIGNDGQKAKVLISDKSNENQSATYDASIIKYPDVNYAVGMQLSNKIIEQTYLKFYKSMGLDSSINLQSLGSKDVGGTVFNLINVAIKIVNDDNNAFNKLLNQLIKDNKDSFNGSNLLSIDELYKNNENSSFTKKVQTLFLTSLNHSNISGNPYWNYLGSGWEKFYKRYVEYVQSQKDTIRKNFDNSKHDFNLLESGINTLRKDILTLKGIGLFNGVNVIEHYKQILELNQKIYKQFKALGEIATNQEIDFSLQSQVKDRFSKGIAELKNEPYEASNWHKNLLLVLGVIIILISVFFAILTLVLMLFKRKGLLKLNIKLILASLVGLSTFVAGIIMTLLGIFGG